MAIADVKTFGMTLFSMDESLKQTSSMLNTLRNITTRVTKGVVARVGGNDSNSVTVSTKVLASAKKTRSNLREMSVAYDNAQNEKQKLWETILDLFGKKSAQLGEDIKKVHPGGGNDSTGYHNPFRNSKRGWLRKAGAIGGAAVSAIGAQNLLVGGLMGASYLASKKKKEAAPATSQGDKKPEAPNDATKKGMDEFKEKAEATTQKSGEALMKQTQDELTDHNHGIDVETDAAAEKLKTKSGNLTGANILSRFNEFFSGTITEYMKKLKQFLTEKLDAFLVTIGLKSASPGQGDAPGEGDTAGGDNPGGNDSTGAGPAAANGGGNNGNGGSKGGNGGNNGPTATTDPKSDYKPGATGAGAYGKGGNISPEKMIKQGMNPLLIESIDQGGKRAFGDPNDPKTRFVVQMQGGYRAQSTGKHGQNKAVDLQIYDRQTGKFVASPGSNSNDIMKNAFNNPDTYRIYEALHQARYAHVKEKYGQEQANRITAGTKFSSSIEGGGADEMHASIDEGHSRMGAQDKKGQGMIKDKSGRMVPFEDWKNSGKGEFAGSKDLQLPNGMSEFHPDFEKERAKVVIQKPDDKVSDNSAAQKSFNVADNSAVPPTEKPSTASSIWDSYNGAVNALHDKLNPKPKYDVPGSMGVRGSIAQPSTVASATDDVTPADPIAENPDRQQPADTDSAKKNGGGRTQTASNDVSDSDSSSDMGEFGMVQNEMGLNIVQA